ncbi:hypothetical protein PR202_ga26671 [Eleusine coracana subsp. coracana]|uniref:CASP-like protein n=1 Tax=Eleusine coracana subsp. coracana TaxID=191504 RepID=A0AAV5DDX3_ELECO|nr:hypothetical protein PR202_ga26671 [Eleusine coracana subsp. coracana]
MFASRPAVHPLQVEAPAPPPPPADPPADQQQPQEPQPQPQEPQPQQPQPQQPQPQEPAAEQAEPEAEQPQGVENPQGVLMKDLPGMPGTPGALGLRIAQLLFAGISVAVMTSTNDFPSVSAFCFLVAAVILQGLWSFMLAIVDVYALMVKRCLRNRRAVRLFAVGDMITGGLTLAGACAAAAITVLIDNDLDICSDNHCAAFQSSVAMTFMCWFSMAPTCLLNLWSMLRPQ